MSHELNINALFALVRIGLWGHTETTETTERISLEKVDWDEVLRLAQEQGVTGLVAQGIENLNANLNFKVPQEVVLQFVGATLQMEQRNKTMNSFIAETVEGLRKEGIYTLLVKGQGIAQCYEKPLWRPSGDVDFFLNNDDYEKAIAFLAPLASNSKPERRYSKEIGFYINQFLVELHGTLRTGLSTRVDKVIDDVQREVFYEGKVRSTQFQVSSSKFQEGQNDNANLNGASQGSKSVQVFMPGVDEDLFLVFTHFIKHFYKEGGVTLRQLCDWCRLLWTYKDKVNASLLEKRLRKAGLMAEWRAFAVVAVDLLGMPAEAMPLFNIIAIVNLNSKVAQKTQNNYGSRFRVQGSRLDKKVEKIVAFILKGGEWRKWRDTMTVARIFPWSTLRFAPGILLSVTWMKVRERIFQP